MMNQQLQRNEILLAAENRHLAGTSGDLLVDVRTKGRWVATPGIRVDDDILLASGKWLRIAKIRGEEMREKGIEEPERYIAAIKNDKKSKLKADILTFTQKLPDIQPKYLYPLEWESVAAISLENFKDWWEGLPQESRKNVRRSQKRGVTIQIKKLDSDVIEGIRGVNDDAPTRQGARNAYYGLTFDETQKRYGEFNDRCDFICAYSGEEMIGFLHLVYREGVAAILNLTVKPSQLDKRPANALMAKAVELSEARNLSYVSYGLYNYGNKRESSLREFKTRNGFKEILVPRYFVPLTPWGSFCVKAKLHRGLIGNLPPSVVSAGLRAKALWFKKFHMPV
jgi:hypothetical protein